MGRCVGDYDRGKGRKRIANKREWKREKAKRIRYSAHAPPQLPSCNHKDTSSFKCAKLTQLDIENFHKMLYANKSKQSQDCLLLKYTNQSLPKKRSETVDGKRKVAVTTTYFVPRKTGNVKVCQKTFLNALRVSKDRVRILCQRHFLKGETPKERRGGYRVNQAFAEKRQTVKNFIDQLQPVESHYGRDKSTRLYLQCDLNIRKLWRLYNSAQGSSCSQVKYEFFRGIFTKDYNISFKTPATDACSTCIELRLSIQNSNGAEKIHNMAMLRVHRLKAKAFYDELRTEKSDTLMLAFDCQKNLVLPKVPDQSAYFSRQLYLFNFTVCAGSSKSEQNKETVTIYPWLENEYYRNANQIASAVFYQLNTTAFETNITNVQLFADGCPGQNKNMVLMGMLMYWLQMKVPKHVKIIEVVFPVVGHSFLPPDRVFGRIERSIKKRESIVNPNEYIEIFEESGTVRQFGNNNLLVYNWKSALGKILKPTAQWHFKISLCKRIKILTSSRQGTTVVKGEISYKNEVSCFRSLLKRGCKLSDLDKHLEIVPPGVPLKSAKVNDIHKLLEKHFGKDWAGDDHLALYKSLVNDNAESEAQEEVEMYEIQAEVGDIMQI